MHLAIFCSSELTVAEMRRVHLEAYPLHIGQQLAEGTPVLDVQVQVIAHLLLARLDLLQLQRKGLSQEVEDLRIEAGVLNPVGDELGRAVHQLKVWHHQDLACFAVGQFLVEAEG